MGGWDILGQEQNCLGVALFMESVGVFRVFEHIVLALTQFVFVSYLNVKDANLPN